MALTYADIPQSVPGSFCSRRWHTVIATAVKELRVLVSYADKSKYEEALRLDTFRRQNTTDEGLDTWAGYDVVPLAGLPENIVPDVFAKPDIRRSAMDRHEL